MSTEKYFLEQNELSFITSIRSWGAQLQGSFKQFQSQLTHSCNLFLPLHELHPIYLCSDLIAVNQFRELEDGKEPPIKQQLAVRRLPSLEDVLHKHQECCRSWGRLAQPRTAPGCCSPALPGWFHLHPSSLGQGQAQSALLQHRHSLGHPTHHQAQPEFLWHSL